MFNIYKGQVGPGAYPQYYSVRKNKLLYPILLILDTCFRQYVQDIVTFIEDHIKESVSQSVRRHNGAQTQVSKQRLTALKQWVKTPNPLSADEHTYAYLLTALHRANGGVLPISEQRGSISMTEFAESTVLMARSNHGSPVTAPFIPKSASVYLLRIAMSIADYQLSNLDPSSRDSIIRQLITVVVNAANIDHLPTYADTPPGARNRKKLVYNLWRRFEESAVQAAAITRKLVEESKDPHAIAMLNAATSASESPDGPWNISSIRLHGLPNVINKRVTPKDFNLKNATVGGTPYVKNSTGYYVQENYHWLMLKFDMNNPVHRIVLYAARIFASLKPKLSTDPNVKPSSPMSPEECVRFLKYMPLKAPTRNGITDPGPIIVLFVGMALGLVYHDSPLSMRIALESNRGGLGTPWTKKHGKFLIGSLFLENYINDIDDGP